MPDPLATTTIPTDEEKLWALAAHIGNIFVPVLIPLGIYLIQKDKSKFVAYHALQASIWHFVMWSLGNTICIGFLVSWVTAIIWGLKAHKGEWVGFPLIEGVGRPEDV